MNSWLFLSLLLGHVIADFYLQNDKYCSQKEENLLFVPLPSERVIRTSKAMQHTVIRTVANSLPKDEVILLTLLSSERYILCAKLLQILYILH